MVQPSLSGCVTTARGDVEIQGSPTRASNVCPVTSPAETTPYEVVGGTPFFDRLVDVFYDGVETDEVLLPLYPDQNDLDGARRRLANSFRQQSYSTD